MNLEKLFMINYIYFYEKTIISSDNNSDCLSIYFE